MKPKRSKNSLIWGVGLIILGLAGVALFHGAGPGFTPFAGWGGGGIYDKGSYDTMGERIYYLGVDSDGDRLRFKGGPHWLYTMGGSCVNCHGPDGRGGFPVMMGTTVPHDIRYTSLVSGEQGHEDGEEGHRYTEADIRRAITDGVDPDGEPLDRTMPRWQMDEEDLEALVDYLKSL